MEFSNLKLAVLSFQRDQLDLMLRDSELQGRARDNVQKNFEFIDNKISELKGTPNVNKNEND